MRKRKKKNEFQSVDSYFDTVEAGERRTLSDEKTKLFLRAKQAMQIVKVDQGIVKDAGILGENQIRKCDYLCKNDAHKQVHLIELKGEVIKDAFLQLENTPNAIKEKSAYGSLLDGLSRMDAYVVSPQKQRVPADIDETKRRLCRKMASYSKERLENIFELLKLVKVGAKIKVLVEKDGVIWCSNECPLEF